LFLQNRWISKLCDAMIPYDQMDLGPEWIDQAVERSDAWPSAGHVAYGTICSECCGAVGPDNTTASIEQSAVDSWIGEISRCTRICRAEFRIIENCQPQRNGIAGSQTAGRQSKKDSSSASR
jgi:hypothetical protein